MGTNSLKLTRAEKSAMLKENMDLVYKIARSYSPRLPNHYEDLVQVGSIGLLNAIKRYDNSKNASFRTYASHLISSEIKHYLRDHSKSVKPPRDLQELLPKVRQAEQRLALEYGREATNEEIAHDIQVSLDKILEVREMEKNGFILSLNQELSLKHNSGAILMDVIEDKRHKSFQLSQEDRIVLQDGISSLKNQSRQVIEFAFYKDLTQTEIAKQLDISQMQVSRRLKKAVKELWEVLNTRVTPW